MLPVVDDPSAAAAAAVGAAASSSFPDADVYGNGDSDDIDFPSDPNHTTTQAFSSATAAAGVGGGGAGAGGAGAGERRPLFQRLWTEEDEIVILRAFAEFTAQRGTAFASHQYDTDPFYEEMRRRLQLDFSKSQLVEKLRRLKRKYRNCVDRLRATGQSFSFRSPHEQAIFEIARGIWRPSSDKHGRDPSAADSDDDAVPDAAAVAVPAPANGEVKSPSSSRAQRRGRRRRTADVNAADASEAPQPYPQVPAPAPGPGPVKAEDALPLPHFFPQGGAGAVTPTAAAHAHGVDPAAAANAEGGILAPLFKEMVRAMLTAGMAPPLGVPEPPALGIPMEGEKWRQQRILELEVYLRRIDLLQDQVRSALEELKSTPATQ
ncbi:probable transcription factor At5g28040 [Oryza brachyantha]|uniref:probable transcription factor At5g28040 n=1 Tax=Oryza brachyantha TaxID=4533 RepID=UPI001AD9B235|nr:probable transcription factor At5g28040 [Oryza brachyantha]